MRLTELKLLREVRQRYMALRSKGLCREQATSRVVCDFQIEAPLDRLAFWIGLADAQYLRKELSISVALQALLALHRLEDYQLDITPGDIERRRKHYSQAPMPEPRLGRPPKNL